MQLVEHGYAVDFRCIRGIWRWERRRQVGRERVGDLHDAVAGGR